MREFTFAITYERGTDPLADEFIGTPELAADSMAVPLGADAFCRIERFIGPRSALDAVERLRTDPKSAGESVGATPCEASGQYYVVEREPERRVVYSYVEGIAGCTAVHALVGKHLDPGAPRRRRGVGPRPAGRAELPGEQRVALREAFRRGYYESPREVSLEELAAQLDIHRSTLSYRLRRAEARLVGSYV